MYLGVQFCSATSVHFHSAIDTLKKPVFYIPCILFSAGTGNIFYYQYPWLYWNSYAD